MEDMAIKKFEWIQPEQRLANYFDVAISRSAVVPEQLLPISFERDPEAPLPSGWEKCLDLQTGRIYFKNWKLQVTTCKYPREEDQHASPTSAACPTSSRRCNQWNTSDFKVKQEPVLEEEYYSSKENLPSLELSLRCDGPQADEDKLSDMKIQELLERNRRVKTEMEQCQRNFLGLNYSMGPFSSTSTKEERSSNLLEVPQKVSTATESYSQEKTSHAMRAPKVEQDSESVKCGDFLGLNFNMGPFSSNAVEADEKTASSYTLDQLAAACTLQSATFCKSTRDGRDMSPLSSKSEIKLVNRKLEDFLGLNFNMGPFSSNTAEVKVECTLEKIEDALRRSKFREDSSTLTTKSNPQNDTRAVASVILKSDRRSFPLSPPSPLKFFSPRSSSPVTSEDASSSSSTSPHSFNSPPSVMRFQGEELVGDRPKGAHGEQGATAFVTVGCTRCLMFVLLSKSNPTCPRCGSTCLIEICSDSSPTDSQQKKRQKLDNPTPCEGGVC